MRCYATPGWVTGTVLLAMAWGCGPSEGVFQPPESDQTLIFPEEDFEPPRFAGISTLEQVGPNDFRVRWEPARDNVTSPERIRYRVVTQGQGFRYGDEPLLVVESEPGETEVRFRGGPYAWPLHVVAVDEAGNVSPMGPGLRVAPQPRWVQVETGLPMEPLVQCAGLGPGEFLCTGEGGSVLRMRRDRWVDHGRQAPGALRISIGGGEAWLWDENGFILRFDDETLVPGGLTLRDGDIDVERPLVSLTQEPGGLWVWRDGRDQVWWGIPPTLRHVQTPVLHRMDYACMRPPVLTWTREGGVALCEDGAVLYQNPSEGALLWEAITSDASVDAPGAMILALDSPGEMGTVVTRSKILQPQAGPWRSLLSLPEGHEIRGVHVLPQGPVLVATTDGLWAFSGQGQARRLRGGAFAGVGPAPVLRTQWQWVAIDAEARLHPGTGDRPLEPVSDGLTRLRLQGWDAEQRVIALAVDGRLLRPGENAWEPLGIRWDGPAPTGVAHAHNTAMVVGGASEGWARRWSGGGWTDMRFLVPSTGEDGGLDFEPLLEKPVEDLVDAQRAGLRVEPLHGVHASGGLAIAWSDAQAWLLHSSGHWVLAARTSSPILYGAALGGDRWMIWTAEGLLRCTDDTCAAPAEADAHGNSRWRSAWMDEGAICAMGDGPLLVACAPPDADASISLVTGFPPDLSNHVVSSTRAEGGVWLLMDDGTFLGQDQAEVPMPVGAVDGALGLFTGADDSVQVLTRQAWLQREPVAIARRQD